jgi:hypothetical protein
VENFLIIKSKFIKNYLKKLNLKYNNINYSHFFKKIQPLSNVLIKIVWDIFLKPKVRLSVIFALKFIVKHVINQFMKDNVKYRMMLK